MKGLIVAGLFVWSLFAQAAHAEVVVGKIIKLRATTNTHPTESARNVVLLSIDTLASEECVWLTFDSSESAVLSMLLSAEARDSEVRVWYTPECEVFTAELR